MHDDAVLAVIAGHVAAAEWEAYASRLTHGFHPIPSAWGLPLALVHRLTLAIQYHYFNPDGSEGWEEKVGVGRRFMGSFLDPSFCRAHEFLRERHEPGDLRAWDLGMMKFSVLMELLAMDAVDRLTWIHQYDSQFRFGTGKRVRVIKKKGLGLECDLLEVHGLMTWEEIKGQYRAKLMEHHPDRGGDAAKVQAVVEAYQELKEARARK